MSHPSRPRRLLAALLAAVAAGGFASDVGSSTEVPTATIPRVPQVTTLVSPPTLDPNVLAMALNATTCAASRGLVDSPETLTVLDYSVPSTDPRLWVLDLHSGETLFEEVVAHGRGSGGNLPRWFSNRPDSHQSSLGLFVTGETYVGENGYSLRLDGLEPGINDNARERAIVMHGAAYVDPLAARERGRLGRSWGCPAVRDEVARALIDRISGGDPVFVYYPDARWVSQSGFLASCHPGPVDAGTS